MHITDYKTLESIPKGSRIWVIETPKIDIHAGLYTFNLTANVNTFYPFNILEKTSEYGERVSFKRVDMEKKVGYDFSILHVYEDLKEYDKLVIHRYIVTTSEREIIKLFKNSIIEFEEATQRALEMSQRFRKDTFQSKLLEEHQIQYPEDWI